MASTFRGYRLAIVLCIISLITLLVVMSLGLLSEQRSLSSAESDNMQWGISELNTEFANFHLALADQLNTLNDDQAELRLRFDIALSRLNLLNSGRVTELFSGNLQASTLLGDLDEYAQSAKSIVDQNATLDKEHIDQLLNITSDIRPKVRELALMGVRIDAAVADQRRSEFADHLRNAGLAIIGVVSLLVVLLLILDRMLHRTRKNDEALINSSKRQSSIIEASLDAIITADEEGRITEYNLAAETVFGWTREEMIGAKMEDTIIPPMYREAHKNGMKRFLETRKPNVVDAGRVELTALRKTGEEFPVELNITSVDDEGGSQFISYLRDISERKISEQKLIEARDRAEKTDKAKSQFLAVMSHEMRTPLNGILGVLDLLGETKLSKQQNHYVSVANASSEILLEHINEALDITRIETGALVPNVQKFDVGTLVAQLLDVLTPLAQEKGLKISHSIESQMNVPLRGDSNRIRQILTNLIGNAIKFTQTGSIEIAVGGIHAPDETSLKIAVRDTGPGIASDSIEEIFSDFTSLANAYGRQTRSDGLGLSISRRIARQLGGDITVDSTLGVGSTFTLKLPLERAADLDSDAQSDDRLHVKSSGRSKTILVVEDNPINRDVMRDMLLGMEHRVFEAADGLEALEQADATQFDLIIMDISMPNMDGLEATQKLRSGGGKNANTNIVGLTAHGQEEYMEQVIEAGMSALFTKPIRLPTLRKLVAGNNKAAQFMPSGNLLDQASLFELHSTLGSKKVEQTFSRFMSELNLFVDRVAEQGAAFDPKELSEQTHKLRGAAALLGLVAIEEKVAALHSNLDVSDLQKVSELTKQEFQATLQSAEKL